MISQEAVDKREHESESNERVKDLFNKVMTMEIPGFIGSNGNTLTSEEEKIYSQERVIEVIKQEKIGNCTHPDCKHDVNNHIYYSSRGSNKVLYGECNKKGCKCKMYIPKTQEMKVCENGVKV